ncbi:MAG: response regulator [Oscillospiraceae bacterium]|nr:response regulator [Oscillospiraceae bacterium]
MKILAADDEPLALEMLTECIEKAAPSAEIHAFSSPLALLAFTAEGSGDVAFLDIKMRGMTGVELAKRLKDQAPDINIVFVTGYQDFAGEAMAMHASGYILKPVTAEKIRAELSDLRRPLANQPDKRVRVQCFGNFDVFVDGKPLVFSRRRAKEIFAYLVHKRGSFCTMQEIAAVLYEDAPNDAQQKNNLRQLISSMTRTFRDAGVPEVIHKQYNRLFVDVEAIDCDYYRFNRMEVDAINAYNGEYMAQYEWAMFVVGYLDNLVLD